MLYIYWQAAGYSIPSLPPPSSGLVCCTVQPSSRKHPSRQSVNQPCPRHIVPVDMDISAMLLHRSPSPSSACVDWSHPRPCWRFDVVVLAVVVAVAWLPTTVHAYTLAIMDLLPLLARLADVPRKANLRSISGRRDLCDFLIKLQIDFYRPLAPGTKWRLRSDSYINRHTARDVPARADDLYICCCVLPDPYPEDDYVCCGCHWACLGCVTAHSQRAEHEMTTTIATYIRVLFCGVDGGWVSEWQWDSRAANLSVERFNWEGRLAYKGWLPIN